jgi:uncharacterized protein (TIGR02284 family)
MHDTQHDIAILNGLIATTLDSADGYETAARDADGHRFAQMFTARAHERRQVVTTLQAEVGRMGGTPEDDGTILAGAHRAFLNLKASITGKDDKAIIDEVERGEDHIKAKYEDALGDTELSPAARTAIETAWHSVREGHDQMRDLKHGMENHA